jgi:hypothetical protein
LGEVVQQLGDLVGVDVDHRQHRRLVTATHHPASARHQRTGRADQLAHRQDLDVAGAAGLERLDCGDALRVAGHRDGRVTLQIEALAFQRADSGHLGQQDARPRDRGGHQILGRGQRLVGGQSAHPFHRLETDRPNDDQVAGERFEQQLGLGDELADLRLDTCGAHQLFEVLQPLATLPAEDDCIRLSCVQTIDQSMGSGMRLRGRSREVGGHSVLLVDRHVLLSPRYCLRAYRSSSVGRRLGRA